MKRSPSPPCARWQQHQFTPKVAHLERLFRILCTAKPGASLDKALSDAWFDVITWFQIPAGKVYLLPMIDYFDVSRHKPDSSPDVR